MGVRGEDPTCIRGSVEKLCQVVKRWLTTFAIGADIIQPALSMIFHTEHIRHRGQEMAPREEWENRRKRQNNLRIGAIEFEFTVGDRQVGSEHGPDGYCNRVITLAKEHDLKPIPRAHIFLAGHRTADKNIVRTKICKTQRVALAIS